MTYEEFRGEMTAYMRHIGWRRLAGHQPLDDRGRDGSG